MLRPERSLTDTDPTTVGVIGAALETPNLGVGALAVGAVRAILNAHPNASVFFLDYARESTTRFVPAGDKRVPVTLANIRFSKKFWLPNNIVTLMANALLMRLIPWLPLRRFLVTRNSHLRTICSATMFTSVAGGDSFGDLYGLPRFIYVALPQILVLVLGKPLVLLPQTYGPFRSPLARLVARWVVRSARQVWCRDHRSLAALMETSAPGLSRYDSHFSYDMAFGIDSELPARIEVDGFHDSEEIGEDVVGVNISGLLLRDGHAGRNQLGLKSDYRALIFAICDVLLAHAEVRILLVPHVYGLDRDSESDAASSDEIFARLRERYPGRIALLTGYYSPNEVRYVIGQCGFFVGSRMHACIAAVSQSIPAVAVAYSDKFADVMDTVGVGSLVADARNLSNDQVLACIERAYAARTSIRRQLCKIMPAIRESARGVLRSQTLESQLREASGAPLLSSAG